MKSKVTLMIYFQFSIFIFCNDNFPQDYSRTTAEGRRIWTAIEEFKDTIRILSDEIENTLRIWHPAPPPQYPDTRPAIRLARKLYDLLGFSNDSRGATIFMNYIDWSIGTARYLMHIIDVTEKDLHQILVQENDNMSIRHLTLHGKNIVDHISKDINKLKYTIKTFLSFADALTRRGDLIFVRL
jgi:hypothetical protein